jgi:hypothetical protein
MLLSCELSERQCCGKRIVPASWFALLDVEKIFQAFIVNQIASATITTTITPQTTGVTFFELPLRGESFGAWL